MHECVCVCMCLGGWAGDGGGAIQRQFCNPKWPESQVFMSLSAGGSCPYAVGHTKKQIPLVVQRRKNVTVKCRKMSVIVQHN